MLKISSISKVKVDKTDWEYRDEWRKLRLGKFTSSMAFTLMGEKPFTQGAMTYIYERAGEAVTGVPAKKEISTEATRWGLKHESEAIDKWGKYLGVEFLVSQALITPADTLFGSTPDAIWPIAAYNDGYDVETAEIKCYPNYEHHIRCVLCDTPQELKKIDSKVYFQVLDQMDNCDCLKGNAVFYHPEFRACAGFKIIKFRKIDLIDDFKLLKERKRLAVEKFNEIRDKLLTLKNAA